MPLAPENWPDLLEPDLREIFTTEMLGRPAPALERLFGVRQSTKFTEHYLNMGAFGRVPKYEGSVEYDRMDSGYRTDISNIELAKGFTVERRLVDDEMYGVIAEFARSLGDAFAITREIDAADIFVQGFTDNGTYRLGDSANGADGVALMSTAHPVSPIRQGTTQSNEATLTLGLDNWDLTRQRMRAFTDDRGELVGGNPDIILVPVELERLARQIFDPRAQWEPGSAEFNLNVFASGVMSTTTIIVWDYLTDANAWFAINSRIMRRQLVWQERVAAEFAREGEFNTLQTKYRGYSRYGRGFTGYHWIYGNNPS